MTDDPLVDFITLLLTFDHSKVAGATIENLAADPTIGTKYDVSKTTDTTNENGYIEVLSSEEGNSDEFGPSRNENYFFSGRIRYNSLTKLTSATIYAIKAEMRRLFNVNNAGNNGVDYSFISGTRFNGNPELGVLTFFVFGMKYGVSAIT